ncbi:MAG: sorbosone dehydrogenase family protein [Acidobacteria bacterium]|nr:sorbosone dehydrogenase family protein [Acidobacteriota bacterium]
MDSAGRTSRTFRVLLALLPLAGCARAADELPLQQIRLPEGFRISMFAGDVPGARSLALGRQGTVFVGTRGDEVYALVDADRDGRAERRHVVAKGLHSPNGVAFRGDALYIAEVSRVLRLDAIERSLAQPPRPAVVIDGLPKDEAHGWKFIAFSPDDWLYVPVGAPCNICDAGDPYASILRFRPDGGGREVYARGIRNTVGFDFRPGSGELWFTDNGRDWLGDDAPPDELNRAPRTGLHFGYPFCHGGDIPDPKFSSRGCGVFEKPVQKLGPHVAALGMRFYTGSMFPAAFRGQVFIAEHGSWNRSRPLGYRLMLVRLEGPRATNYEVFAEGWLRADKPWGRPVDVLVMPDGALLVSDDHAGAVYRITYQQPAGAGRGTRSR